MEVNEFTKIERFLDCLECPTVDGVIFPDQSIQILDVKISCEKPVKFSISPSYSTSINELEKAGKLHWNHCAIIHEFVDEKKCLKAVCGEGNYGSDGFVSLINSTTGNTRANCS
ncbi:MAG: hypothetical protein V4577_19940 [Bacteroidota bacterium]